MIEDLYVDKLYYLNTRYPIDYIKLYKMNKYNQFYTGDQIPKEFILSSNVNKNDIKIYEFPILDDHSSITNKENYSGKMFVVIGKNAKDVVYQASTEEFNISTECKKILVLSKGNTKKSIKKQKIVSK